MTHRRLPFMQRLRDATRLARWALAALWLSTGLVLASPVAQPQSFELICSGTGLFKLVVHADEGVQELDDRPMDCPACQIIAGAPPALVGWQVPPWVPGRVAPPEPPFHHVRLAGAPPPSRGPPLSV